MSEAEEALRDTVVFLFNHCTDDNLDLLSAMSKTDVHVWGSGDDAFTLNAPCLDDVSFSKDWSKPVRMAGVERYVIRITFTVDSSASDFGREAYTCIVAVPDVRDSIQDFVAAVAPFRHRQVEQDTVSWLRDAARRHGPERLTELLGEALVADVMES